jgi:hypothetical protein
MNFSHSGYEKEEFQYTLNRGDFVNIYAKKIGQKATKNSANPTKNKNYAYVRIHL